MADPRSTPIYAHMAATAHHIDTGAYVFPYAIDAHSAVSRFPNEWSFTPWHSERRDRALAARRERHESEVARAQAAGLPEPAPPPEPVPLEPEDQAAIDAHTQAQAEAAKRLEEFDAQEAARKKIEDQVAADRALVAQPPPMPDPNAPRRPFGRKGEPTAAERAMLAKRGPGPKPVADQD